MSSVKARGKHPVALDGGRVLAVGETAHDVDTGPGSHASRLIAAGVLVVVPDPEPPARKTRGRKTSKSSLGPAFIESTAKVEGTSVSDESEG